MKAYMIKLAYTRLVLIKKDNKKGCTCQVTLASDLDNKKGSIRLGSTYSYKKCVCSLNIYKLYDNPMVQ
jgi:hypothetical protein